MGRNLSIFPFNFISSILLCIILVIENITYRQITETEFWIGENRIYLIPNNIIHVIAVGYQSASLAIVLNETNSKLALLINGKINYLIDLNKSGKSSPEAREIWNKIGENEKTGKVAIFGIHPVARVLATFVMGMSKKNNSCFFKTEEGARKWLAE